jgi:Fe-S-cluster containining protein
LINEDKAEPLDVISSKEFGWTCLGAGCPVSCCYHMYARIYIHEILPLSKCFPIIFAMVDRPGKKPEMDICIILNKTGSPDNGCVYLQKGSGCTLGDERPTACKQYPFIVARNDNDEDVILVRPSCPGFSDNSGYKIIIDDNKISPVLNDECIKPAVKGCEASEETGIFVQTLNKFNLIVPGLYNYRGGSILFMLVDAKRLMQSPPEVRDDFRAKGYMELIMAHMDSLGRL